MGLVVNAAKRVACQNLRGLYNLLCVSASCDACERDLDVALTRHRRILRKESSGRMVAWGKTSHDDM